MACLKYENNRRDEGGDMSFFGGIKKVFEGLAETAEAPVNCATEVIYDSRVKVRSQLTGEYEIPIIATSDHPELVAKVLYDGASDDIEVVLLSHPNKALDVWDDLSDAAHVSVNLKVQRFIRDLKIAKGLHTI